MPDSADVSQVAGLDAYYLNLNLVYTGKPTQPKEGWLKMEWESDSLIVCAGQRVIQEG